MSPGGWPTVELESHKPFRGNRIMMGQSPSSVFNDHFLELFGRRDESCSSSEAELSGRWKIVEREGAFELYRQWEGAASDPPFATFHRLEHALLFAAMAPAASRTPVYQGNRASEDDRNSIFCGGDEVGTVRWFDQEIVNVLNVGAYLVRNPLALALLLEAAGPSALAAVGRLLFEQTKGCPTER
jgi:hypothetical protein